MNNGPTFLGSTGTGVRLCVLHVCILFCMVEEEEGCMHGGGVDEEEEEEAEEQEQG